MDDYNFMDYLEDGCPSCGAKAGDDCYESCQGVPVPTNMYTFIDEQLAYATHKIGRRIMNSFEQKIFTEKSEDVLSNWGDFTNLASALVNSGVLMDTEDMLEYIKKPNKYVRHYLIWAELGKPVNEDRETWTMFMEAIRNTNGEQT